MPGLARQTQDLTHGGHSEMVLAGTRLGPAARIPHHEPKDCQPPFGRGQPFGPEWTTAQGCETPEVRCMVEEFVCMAVRRMNHAKSEPAL